MNDENDRKMLHSNSLSEVKSLTELMASNTKVYCKICKLYFTDQEVLRAHKRTSDRHIICFVCDAEFYTLEAKDRHQKQDHAHRQELRCPLCGIMYPTLGAYTSHLEEKRCLNNNLRQEVHKRTERQRQQRAARNYVGGRNEDAMGGMNVEPLPPLRDYSALTEQKQGETLYSPSSVSENKEVAGGTSGEVATRKDREEDLLSFDDLEAIHRSGWIRMATDSGTGTSDSTYLPPHLRSKMKPVSSANADVNNGLLGKTQLPSNSKASFPPRQPSASSTPSTSTNKIPLSATTQNQHPSPVPLKQTTNIQNLTTTLQGATLTETRAFDPNRPDPDHPSFHPQPYYIRQIHKYRCPFPGCRKNFSQGSSFTDHLRSPAHRGEKLQCHTCLNYFDTATALAQHASAQGTRCRVRDTNQYDGEVDRFTAGMATTDGRWEDNTIKYAVRRGGNLPVSARELVNAVRAEGERRAEKVRVQAQNEHVQW